MRRHGYETAVKGKNSFVCMVERSWTAGIDDPDFWNPKLRAPICFNPPGARSYLPLTIKKTELVLVGQSKAQMFDNIKAAFDRKELPTPEPGAMCYMMSKQGCLSDRDGQWHPRLMFFVPQTDAQTWGANLPGSPILSRTETSASREMDSGAAVRAKATSAFRSAISHCSSGAMLGYDALASWACPCRAVAQHDDQREASYCDLPENLPLH